MDITQLGVSFVGLAQGVPASSICLCIFELRELSHVSSTELVRFCPEVSWAESVGPAEFSRQRKTCSITRRQVSSRSPPDFVQPAARGLETPLLASLYLSPVQTDGCWSVSSFSYDFSSRRSRALACPNRVRFERKRSGGETRPQVGRRTAERRAVSGHVSSRWLARDLIVVVGPRNGTSRVTPSWEREAETCSIM